MDLRQERKSGNRLHGQRYAEHFRILKVNMDNAIRAISADLGSPEPPDNPLVAFSSQPRFSTWLENASTEMTESM
jgi:hypothetical protein